MLEVLFSLLLANPGAMPAHEPVMKAGLFDFLEDLFNGDRNRDRGNSDSSGSGSSGQTGRSPTPTPKPAYVPPTFSAEQYGEPAEGFSVADDQTKKIDKHKLCKVVGNKTNEGYEVFIPTETEKEWRCFVGRPPAGMTLNACAPPSTGGAWVNITPGGGESHAAACARIGRKPAKPGENGYGICASAETWATVGLNWDKIHYPSLHKNTKKFAKYGGYTVIGRYCYDYKPGVNQKRDNDSTDINVAYRCADLAPETDGTTVAGKTDAAGGMDCMN